MPKLLIVSPRFPPKNLPDLHRIRISLPYYRQFGWSATVLALDPASSDGVDDELLASSLPADVAVHRATAWDENKCRRFGFGHVAYRSLVPLLRLGSSILKHEKYDVIFFSTTLFLSFILGPFWKWRFGCKLVYDIQDPWYAGKENSYDRNNAPGSWWKYRLDQWLAKYLERFSLRNADHIVAVSHGYVATLHRRYPSMRPSQFTVIPFGASQADYDFLLNRNVEAGLLRTGKDAINWVSVGAFVHHMTPVLRAMLLMLADIKSTKSGYDSRLKLYFIGTNYVLSARTREIVEPLARECRMQTSVEEHTGRVPYFQSLSLYRNSDAILLIGSIYGDYTASRFFNCVLSKRPILALFHRDSLVSKLAPLFPNVFLATFDKSPSEPEFKAQLRRGIEWLSSPVFDCAKIDLAIEPWLAKTLTAEQCRIFDDVTSVPSAADKSRIS